MPDVRKLIRDLAAQEDALRGTEFLAPCVRGGRVRTRVAGLVYTFKPQPADFAGWGIFKPLDVDRAALVYEASPAQVAGYLHLFKTLRLRLIDAARHQTWLAYPANESDARQRFGMHARPVPVHLVTEGAPFEQVVARWDGSAWWFEEVDRRAAPQHAEALREALKAVIPPETLRIRDLTPEMRTAYDLAAQQALAFAALMQQRRDEARLREALSMAGGELQGFQDRSEFWLVEWTTAGGERHSSAIAKADLAVIGAGICLSGRDRDFDLQSLVGVVAGRD